LRYRRIEEVTMARSTWRSASIGLAALGSLAACAAAPPAGDDPADLPGGKGDLFSDDGLVQPIEVKVTLTAESAEVALEALGLDPDDAEERQITFYDTPDLALFEAGVVLRARKIIDGPDDSTIKLRPMAPADAVALIPEVVQEDGFKCEIDRMVEREVSSCSLTVEQDRGEIDDVADGDRRIDQLFSGEQELVFDTLAPTGVEWGDLETLGPVYTERWRTEPDALRERLTVERWELPEGGILVELSMRVDGDGESALEELLAFIDDAGLEVGPSATKTRTVLEQLAARR
jgi:hypothetical protein